MLLRIDDEDAGTAPTHARLRAGRDRAGRAPADGDGRAAALPPRHLRPAGPAQGHRLAGPGRDGRLRAGHHQRVDVAEDAVVRRAGGRLRRDDPAVRGARRRARARPRGRPRLLGQDPAPGRRARPGRRALAALPARRRRRPGRRRGGRHPGRRRPPARRGASDDGHRAGSRHRHVRDGAPDHRAGAGALDGGTALRAARRHRGAFVRRRVRDLRARQRARPRHRPVRRPGRAADLARPERAGHGARGDRLRPGDGPASGHGGDVVGRSRGAQHGHRGRAGRTPTGCRCCCCPATRSPDAGPTRCCSRSSTSATRPRASTTRSGRSPATSTGSPGRSSCSRRCPRWRGCSPTRPTPGRWCSACRRTCRPRSTTSRWRCSRPGCTACRGSAPTSGRSPRRP